MGESNETSIANSAIETIVSMGISKDIAQALVVDTLIKNPDIKLIQIVQLATMALTDAGKEREPSKKGKSKPMYTSRGSWGQLAGNDLRKMHAEKSGSMYEVIQERGINYPIQELLAS